jgi:imidazolonepropionase-like amidohydrolase
MGLIADGPLAVRKAVRRVGREGGRWVKIWASGGILSEYDDPTHVHFFPDELAAIVTEAHAIGLPVGAHSESLLSAQLAVAAGVDAIEHGFELDDETCARMAENGTYLVSTLSVLRRYVDWDRGELSEEQRATSRGLLTIAEESLRRAIAAGVKVAMGSDSFAEPMTPFGRSADELAYMTDAGADPETCLRAATIIAAELCGLGREIGSIEVGKRADIVVLDGDPRDIVAQLSTTRRPLRVMKDGEWVEA